MNAPHVARAARGLALVLVLGAALLAPQGARAHCDGLDGPVVKAARIALEQQDVNRVLIWVRPENEPALREAFAQTLAVRKLGGQARDLADRYFFETLVRLHREGEGAPYTGLKPAGRDLGPAIPGADRALETGDIEPLVQLLVSAVSDGVRARFAEARSAQAYGPQDVAAGREYVGRYVPFLHYVEAIYATATARAVEHPRDEAEPAAHAHGAD